MNTPILFLLAAVALSALGGMVVWIASRPRPEKFGSSIDTFNRDLNALAPPGSQKKQSRRPARPARPAATQRSSASAKSGDLGPRPQQPATSQGRPKPGPRPRS